MIDCNFIVPSGVGAVNERGTLLYNPACLPRFYHGTRDGDFWHDLFHALTGTGRMVIHLRRSLIALAGLIVGLYLLVACGQKTPTASSTPTSTPEPSNTATNQPPRLLTVCLGQEPTSLFPQNNPSMAARSVLAAIYDGPIDMNSYGAEAVILARMPSIENGDATLFAQSVYVGDEVVDASGTPVTLAVGVKVLPAGCHSQDCAVEYDGLSEIQMDQMQVTFNMLPGLTWSDGEPLTAGDSVYAYQVAASSTSTAARFIPDRTRAYEAADETTAQWWGKPGFIDPTFYTNFWSPLPEHLWGQVSMDQLRDTEAASRSPLGWGAYMLQEWAPGDHIALVKNPRYFRAGEGLPRFDILTFRFVPDPEAAIRELTAGSCDILDPSIHLDGQMALLRSLAEEGQLQAFFTRQPVMEALALGIQPASYDNGYAVGRDRVDFFGDVRVRQALATCLDRQQVVDSVLMGQSSVPDSYLPQDHPLHNPNAASYRFDVAAASQLLDEAGWKDEDHDPSTPRQAWGVAGIPSGTPFEVNYVTTDAAQRQQAGILLAASLAQCGIKVNVEYVDAETLYAPGPDGILFGRNFDLVEFAMGTTGIETPCDWYSSSEIPNATNLWVGTNVSGYHNPEFDVACLAAQKTLPGDPAQLEAYALAQSIFARDLPVIPLYWRVAIAAVRPDLCHFSPDPTATSSLWNVEAFDIGTDCRP
jgi:peptide/nickel transport system substrate-binding protein